MSPSEYAICFQVSGPSHKRLSLFALGYLLHSLPWLLLSLCHGKPGHSSTTVLSPLCHKDALRPHTLFQVMSDLRAGSGYSQLSTVSSKCLWKKKGRGRKKGKKEMKGKKRSNSAPSLLSRSTYCPPNSFSFFERPSTHRLCSRQMCEYSHSVHGGLGLNLSKPQFPPFFLKKIF